MSHSYHPRSEYAGGPDALAEGSSAPNWSGHTHVSPSGAVRPANAPESNKNKLPEGIISFHQVEVVHSEWAGGHAYAEGSNPHKVWYAPQGSKESYATVAEAVAARVALQQGMAGAKSTSQMPPIQSDFSLVPQQAL